jgi:stearoyl-CoA desaturase (Delta-9 desaturase)
MQPLFDDRTDPPDATDSAPLRVSPSVLIANLFAVVLPFAGIVIAAVLLWQIGFDWMYLGIFLGMYILVGLGVTLGFHRLFTHRSFDCVRPVQAILAVLGSMSVEGPVLKWVAVHRRHHQLSDRAGDPHSPHLHGEGFKGLFKGLWHAHLGWTFRPDPPGLQSYIKDLIPDRMLGTISRLFTFWAVLGLLIPAALGGLLTLSWTGVLLGFLWGGLARIFLLNHVTWSINSVCHLWGTRPFRSRDESRNNFVFGVLALGEGWHNNHHAFPYSARHGLRWWEVDFSYWTLRGLSLLGLVRGIKLPPAMKMAEKRRR